MKNQSSLLKYIFSKQKTTTTKKESINDAISSRVGGAVLNKKRKNCIALAMSNVDQIKLFFILAIVSFILAFSSVVHLAYVMITDNTAATGTSKLPMMISNICIAVFLMTQTVFIVSQSSKIKQCKKEGDNE